MDARGDELLCGGFLLNVVVSVIGRPIGEGRWPSRSWPSLAALIIFQDQFKICTRLSEFIVLVGLQCRDDRPKSP
jgi:hypothetical protein